MIAAQCRTRVHDIFISAAMSEFSNVVVKLASELTTCTDAKPNCHKPFRPVRAAGVWRRIGDIDYHDPGLRLAAIWFGVLFLIFSLISGKQLHYLLPTFPAIALFLERRQSDGSLYAPIAVLLPAGLGIGAIAVATGAFEVGHLGTLAQPSWLFIAMGIVLILSASTMIKRRDVGAYLAGPVLIVVLNCIFLLGVPGIVYDTSLAASALASHGAKGIAVLDKTVQESLRSPVS
ncbi:4-amino-4-deoxy-L-arabinose transferase-like glycosyltransferase [Pararhizobium capsulatum DSM 1112]|uniref:4-amino-4-deoxy-L-arabinose transferase-like glycosyltransferase n=1 Tax=Pararhizobium capsulatum DSM 1112 TaxID=1121113 RepID=A0ABU0BQ25_9HYPH|nr:hypothetical protein [Pararhizobium capsulatum]MDQ0320355.1 4-amino-4-deoxy-L-arabinose transferase-like glycosyltransferase [Pararhizobium capsulatum DSM 1112]